MSETSWEQSTIAPIQTLSPSAAGHLIALCDGGRALVFAGTPDATDASHLLGNRPAPADVVQATDAASGCFSRARGARALVRVSSGKSTEIAAGAGAIESFFVAGEQIAIAREDGVEFWNVAGTRRWAAGEGRYVAVTLVGKLVVALHESGEVSFFALMTGSIVGSIKLELAEPATTWHLATLNATRFVLALADYVVIVDAAKEKVLRRTRVRARVCALCVTERRIFAGLADGWVEAIDTLTGESKGAISAHEEPVHAIAAFKSEVYTASAAGPLKAWKDSVFGGTPRAAAPVSALAAADGLVVVGDSSGRVRVLNGVEEMASLRLDGKVAGVTLLRDGAFAAVTSTLVVRVQKPWNKPEPTVLAEPPTAFTADEDYIFSGHRDGHVDVREYGSTKLTARFSVSDGAISCLLRSRSMLIVGTDSLDGKLYFVDLATGDVVHELEAHQEAFGVTCVAAEARGKLLASGSDDGTIALIDVAKARVAGRVRLAEGPVSLAFDASGKRLVAALANGACVQIALDRKGEITPLALPSAALVACSASSTSVVVGLRDGRVELASPA